MRSEGKSEKRDWSVGANRSLLGNFGGRNVGGFRVDQLIATEALLRCPFWVNSLLQHCMVGVPSWRFRVGMRPSSYIMGSMDSMILFSPGIRGA